MKMCFFAAAALALPLSALAQSTGELWEITSQMNIPGMPAGMGGQTQRVCQGDDPERRAASDKDQRIARSPTRSRPRRAPPSP
jgi:hypothetical protein